MVPPLAAQAPVSAPLQPNSSAAQQIRGTKTGIATPKRTSQPKRTSGMSVEQLSTVALVLGLLGVFLMFLVSIPAIICGHVALHRSDPVWTPRAIRRRAQWGLALGYGTTILWIAVLVLSSVH